MSRVIELSSKNFDRILKSSRKVFVDFWAPWCAPCVKMDPVVEKLANRHASITFAKINVDIGDNQEIANRFHISSIPAYVMFNDSSPASSRIGATSEAELEKWLGDSRSL
jgi:thioredoxin 1